MPDTADLELVQEPQRFCLTSDDKENECLFETAAADILEEMCEEGYFDDGRPVDEVAFLLDDGDFEQLTDEQRHLYDEQIYPLMRIWFFERNRFEEEYARRRASLSGPTTGDRMIASLNCLPHDVRRRSPDFVIDSRSCFTCATASHPAQESGEMPSKRKSLYVCLAKRSGGCQSRPPE
ncbi:hypothetical protein [Mesorhizobium sp.]|uniref:hypothetical protein n=1 Tax=Mesorhizobium sp. TaxID=1871066 RepID=UPI000FE48F22|nr:hypothetical protein [Mesorhizobium sp.]RWM43696.1 MAG: hypothetical protein EOR76_28485 [Mesorhizobium sp.]RWM58282.1 MAG: hypothetical protein EOR79_14895 [Mesorhizobium sp.]RWM58552.1 MAG: hypothetical protein EOR78_05380 [Mesorhizobium sp.]TIO63962.1 MAG: hypothetical protein E5X85_35200 [Mesorhizobium sp.]TJV89773.1 MAG: hypothetical protein E5X84_19890 [Mesorhizobium sp.]